MRTAESKGTGRGLSPVIGVSLMVAITVVLAAIVGALVFGLTDPSEPAPDVEFDVEFDEEANETVIVHDRGERIDSGEISLVGAEATDESLMDDDGEWGAKRGVPIEITDDEVQVVWSSGDGGTSHVVDVVEPPTIREVPDGIGFDRDDGTEIGLSPVDDTVIVSAVTVYVDDDEVEALTNVGSNRPEPYCGVNPNWERHKPFCSAAHIAVDHPDGQDIWHNRSTEEPVDPAHGGATIDFTENDPNAPQFGIIPAGAEPTITILEFRDAPGGDAEPADMVGKEVTVELHNDNGENVFETVLIREPPEE